jgi:hypothetical protein
MLIDNLLIAISFHYDEFRLKYLRKICVQIPFLAFNYKLLLFTNASDQISYDKICDHLKDLCKFEIITFNDLAHPFFLTWSHKPIFKNYLLADNSYTHFMYLEDDIQITPDNINYWLRGRCELLEFGLYPSFVRYELNNKDNSRYATDITKKLKLKKYPHKFISSHYAYLNSPQPYQGMYLMDRKMMLEYIDSPAYSPDFGSWNIREKATQGLTFVNVPRPFLSRNLIGINVSKKLIDPGAIIHHLPGNYANNPMSLFGKISIDELIIF